MSAGPGDAWTSRPGAARAPGVTPSDLARAEAVLGWALPPSLRALYRATDGLRDDQAQLHVVWTLERLVEENLGPWCEELSAHGLVAFGTDGAGTSFCLLRDEDPTVLGWYPVDQAAHPVARSLEDFWAAWVWGEGLVT